MVYPYAPYNRLCSSRTRTLISRLARHPQYRNRQSSRPTQTRPLPGHRRRLHRSPISTPPPRPTMLLSLLRRPGRPTSAHRPEMCHPRRSQIPTARRPQDRTVRLERHSTLTTARTSNQGNCPRRSVRPPPSHPHPPGQTLHPACLASHALVRRYRLRVVIPVRHLQLTLRLRRNAADLQRRLPLLVRRHGIRANDVHEIPALTALPHTQISAYPDARSLLLAMPSTCAHRRHRIPFHGQRTGSMQIGSCCADRATPGGLRIGSPVRTHSTRKATSRGTLMVRRAYALSSMVILPQVTSSGTHRQ